MRGKACPRRPGAFALLYSVLIPNAFVAGVAAFFTLYILNIAPVVHSGNQPHVHYFLGGPSWVLANYWSSLSVYAGSDSPVKALLISGLAALNPLGLALALFVRRAF